MKAKSQTLFTVLYVTLIILFRTGNSSAQTVDQTKLGIRGGIVAGINASQIDGDDYTGYHKVGVNAGFYAQIPVGKMFFFSTEILYSQKGGKSPTYQGIPIEFSWALNYAEVPILFHFQEKQAFNLGAGLSYSRLLGENLVSDGEPQPDIMICNGKPADTDLLSPSFLCLNKNNLDVVVDGNYLPTKHIALNVRYAYSITALGYNGSSNFINRSMHLNMLSFRLMWIFGG